MTARAATRLPYSFWLFSAGIFACTWDTLLTLELSGFTFKSYQLFFALSLGAVFAERKQEGLALLSPLGKPFAACMLLLAGIQMGLAPWSAFPLKSFLYSGWLIFDVLTIWLTAQHLARTIPLERFMPVVWGTMLFLSLIVLIDHTAYKFGYIGGLIGSNQDAYLHWGVSRPHAFSFEPSYLACFLSLGLVMFGNEAFRQSKRKGHFWLGLFLVVFAVIGTTSRTGLVSIVGGILTVLALQAMLGRRVQWRTLGIVLATSLFASAAFFVLTPPAQRVAGAKFLLGSILEGKDGSGNARMRAFALAYRFASETNWVGTGMGASYRYFLEHGGTDLLTPDPISLANSGNEVIMSTWGQLMAEGGIHSLLLYATASFFLLLGLFQAWKRDDATVQLGSLAAALVFFGFTAFFLGNICRGDVWVWYALWSIPASQRT